jgi:hypothetical protein
MVTVIKAGDAAAVPAQAPASALDALEAEARNLEAHGGPVPPGVQGSAQPGPTPADELHSTLVMVRSMLGPMMAWWPEFDRVWSESTLRSIAQAGAMVMERQGLTMGQLLGQWGPYLALIGATAPPAVVTYQAVKQRQREAAQKGGYSDGGAGPSAG